MIPEIDGTWKCKNEKCNYEMGGYQSEIESGVVAPKCRKCGGEMDYQPLVHRGPGPKNPFIKC